MHWTVYVVDFFIMTNRVAKKKKNSTIHEQYHYNRLTDLAKNPAEKIRCNAFRSKFPDKHEGIFNMVDIA